MSSPEAEETYRTVASLTRSSPADGELQQHHEQHSPIGAVEQKLVWDPAAHANRLAELAELAAVAGVDEPEPYVAPVRAQAPRRDPVYGDPASGLDDTMRTAYQAMREIWHSRQDVEDLRVAAYIVSIGRVAQTYRSKGL